MQSPDNTAAQGDLQGTVVAAYGKRYKVELAETMHRISCVTRGKKTDVACGDHVTVKLTDKREGVIENIVPRTTLLYRSNAFKSKTLAIIHFDVWSSNFIPNSNDDYNVF